MIDGFKEEYLKYAPYLENLTKKYIHGRLEMPLGFWGGVETFFRGKSDILAFFCKNKNSSIKWTKKFAFLDIFGKFGRLFLEIIINFQRLIKRRELFRTGKIPLDKLYKFDTEVKKPFYRVNGVDYKYYGDLDKIAHKYGTKNARIIEAIKKIDEKISRAEFDIIFSDHGMIDIKNIITVPETEDCFIDSTMARYWGKKPEIKSKLGKWVSGNEKYGHYIFLVKPGVLIFPNYWQNKNPEKAMHGYEPCEDMKGIYIIKKIGKKKNIRVDELHKIFKEIKENGK